VETDASLPMRCTPLEVVLDNRAASGPPDASTARASLESRSGSSRSCGATQASGRAAASGRFPSDGLLPDALRPAGNELTVEWQRRGRCSRESLAAQAARAGPTRRTVPRQPAPARRLYRPAAWSRQRHPVAATSNRLRPRESGSLTTAIPLAGGRGTRDASSRIAHRADGASRRASTCSNRPGSRIRPPSSACAVRRPAAPRGVHPRAQPHRGGTRQASDWKTPTSAGLVARYHVYGLPRPCPATLRRRLGAARAVYSPSQVVRRGRNGQGPPRARATRRSDSSRLVHQLVKRSSVVGGGGFTSQVRAVSGGRWGCPLAA
jgi:hypothetical protein